MQKTIYVLEPVKGMEVIDLSNDTIEPETKRFLVEIQTVGTNSCLLADYGEKPFEDFYTFGDSKNCAQLFPNIKSVHNQSLSKTMELSKKYSKPRDYYPKFTLANRLSRIIREMSVTVLGKYSHCCGVLH